MIYNGIYGYSHVSSTASPPGANLPCKPSSAHPYPVILVHGTFEDMSDSWQALSPLLYDNGYCVFALNYGSYNGSGAFGVYGTGYIEHSAVNELGRRSCRRCWRDRRQQGRHRRPLAGRDDAALLHQARRGQVRERAGGPGAVQPRDDADGLFTLASYFPGASSLVLADCPACQEQEAGSPFITSLNTPVETYPGIKYTVIESRNDEVVTPYTSAFLIPAPNTEVTNITLQNQCALDQGEHLSMPYDHIADTDVLNALDPSANYPTVCTPVAPVSGG